MPWRETSSISTPWREAPSCAQPHSTPRFARCTDASCAERARKQKCEQNHAAQKKTHRNLFHVLGGQNGHQALKSPVAVEANPFKREFWSVVMGELIRRAEGNSSRGAATHPKRLLRTPQRSCGARSVTQQFSRESVAAKIPTEKIKTFKFVPLSERGKRRRKLCGCSTCSLCC